MGAIYRRELRNYFISPLGYVFIAVLLFFEGFQFYNILGAGYSEYFALIYSFIFTFCMMMIPVLTMRLLSEEKKQKTDQALLTAPVSLGSIVFGKFLAAFTVYAVAIGSTLIHAFVMSFFGPTNWGSVFGNIIGSLLYGAALIAIGLFISGLTDSQMIAAIGSFAISIFLLVVDQLVGLVNSPVMTKIADWVSFYSRYVDFTQGIFNFASVIFFLSIAGVFLYLSVSTLEKRRWS